MMTQTIYTARGRIEYMPRAEMATYGVPTRRATPPTVDTSRLCGFTVHYAGGPIARYHEGFPLIDGDIRHAKGTIANHLARVDANGSPTHSDVGYNLMVGRSGVLFDGRGLVYMNGANGATSSTVPAFKWFPGVRTTNPHYQSIYLMVGTDTVEGYDQPTKAQVATLRLLAAWMVDEVFKFPQPHPLWPLARMETGHRDVRATACPGEAAYSLIGGLYTPPPVCPPFDPANRLWGNWPNVPKPTLSAGSTGDPVRYLQGVLTAYGYTAPITGVYDGQTTKAVQSVEKSNRLDPDGICGPEVWAIIDPLAVKKAG